MGHRRFVTLLISAPLLLILGAAVYFFVGQVRKAKNDTAVPPPAKSQRVNLVIGEPAISPILSFKGDNVWFISADGKMYRKAVTGDKEKEAYVLSQVLDSPRAVIWPVDGSDFIVEQSGGGQIRYNFYDAAAKSFVLYPAPLKKPNFLAKGDKIVYEWSSGPDTTELKVSDGTGQNFKKITDLYRGDYELVASPRFPEVVLFVRERDNPSKLFLVDLLTGGFQSLSEQASYEGVKFSPDGTKLLAAKFLGPDQQPELLLLDLKTRQTTDLGIPAAVEQTAWSTDSGSFYVGLSGGFVKYDLASKEQAQIYQFSAAEKFEPVNLLVPPQQSRLFFADKKTGNLYRLDLK